VNKGLRIFALAWVALLAILNVFTIGSLLEGTKNLAAQGEVRTGIYIVLAWLAVDVVLCTPALAAEWLRGIRIASARRGASARSWKGLGDS